MFEVIFTVKVNTHFWTADNLNYQRAWLTFEVMFYFTWIQASVLFVAYAYLMKFKSVAKNEDLLKDDDDVWNDKWSTDFLRYLKLEYYLITYLLTTLSTMILVGFTNFYRVDMFGPRDFKVTGYILCVLIFGKLTSLTLMIKQLI